MKRTDSILFELRYQARQAAKAGDVMKVIEIGRKIEGLVGGVKW